MDTVEQQIERDRIYYFLLDDLKVVEAESVMHEGRCACEVDRTSDCGPFVFVDGDRIARARKSLS